jgi:hypothetical protein
MELDDLKDIWKQQEEKIDHQWQLNVKTLKQTNLDKAKSKLRSLSWVVSITLLFYLLMAMFFMIFGFRNLEIGYFALSGFVLSLWSLLVATGSIGQLRAIHKIDYTEPIPILQTKLEKLKLIILKYLQLAQWIFPFYLSFVIFWSKVLFDFDIVANAGNTWLLIQLIFSICLIPVSIWLHRKLRPENINKKWITTLMLGSGSQVSDAIAFIKRIEAFEKHSE